MIDYLIEGFQARSVRIAVYGSYSGKNKGDVAILISLLHQLFTHTDHIAVVLTSKSPALLTRQIMTSLPDAKSRSITIRRSVTSYLGIGTITEILRSDLVLIGGGGLFFSRSLWNPFVSHLINIWVVTCICRALATPYRLAYVGASHLTTPGAQSLTRYVIRHADRIVTRDTHTFHIFQQIYPKAHAMRHDKDIAFRYPLRASNSHSDPPVSIIFNQHLLQQPYIIVNIFDGMLVNTPHLNLNTTARTIIYNLQKQYPPTKYTYVLYANNEATSCFAQLQTEVNGLISVSAHERTIDEILTLLDNAKLILSSQLHVFVFAQLVNTCTIPLVYDEKVRAQIDNIGCLERIQLKEL